MNISLINQYCNFFICGFLNKTTDSLTVGGTDILVATVGSNGKVTTVGLGTANIACTTKDGSKKTAICKVTVTKQMVL